MKISKFALACFSLALVSASALAQDSDAPSDNAVGDIAGRFYVSPMASYTFADTHRETDNAIGGLHALGRQLNPYANFELYGSYADYGSKGSDAHDGRLWTGGAAVTGFPFALKSGGLGRWLGGAYGVVGVNYADGSDCPTRTGLFDQNRHGYLFDFGGGYLVRIPFIHFASLRFDARYRMDFVSKPFASIEPHDEGNNKPNLDDVMLSVGLLIPIGSLPPPPAPPPAPQVVAPAAPVPPADSDGDGVVDPLDHCPGTPPGTAVDSDGCPLPPPCRTPEPGDRVDLAGCTTGDSIVLRGVNFDFDKATLTPNARIILDSVVSALLARPDIKVEIDGHTDGKGSHTYNLKLSVRRAAAVVEYLKQHGIDAQRLTSQGFGETQPIADNQTDEGRELNRRVELKILESQVQPRSSSAAATAQPAPNDPAAAQPDAVLAAPAPAP